MYGILPYKQVKWKINYCTLCDLEHTLEHLLFDCHRAVYLWNCVESVCRVNINFSNVVYGVQTDDKYIPIIITLLGFLLYKEWLVSSLEYHQRHQISPITFLYTN